MQMTSLLGYAAVCLGGRRDVLRTRIEAGMADESANEGQKSNALN